MLIFAGLFLPILWRPKCSWIASGLFTRRIYLSALEAITLLTSSVLHAMDAVKEIDISPFTNPGEHDESSRDDVLKAWDESFRSLGFAVLKGHGVPLQEVIKMQANARQFFEQSMEVKMKSCLRVGYGRGGYVPMGVESVARSLGKAAGEKPPDIVENICFLEGAEGNDTVPETPKSLKMTVQNYWQHMQRLLSMCMEISALSLGLPTEYFAPYHTNPHCSLRLAHYPAQDKAKPKENQLRYGPHTDYTGFTFLRPDPEVGGLECRNPKTSEWIPVNATGDSFIVNAGDLIQQWTNDRWISNLHRVVNPPEHLKHKARLSVVFFTGPNPDAVIAPLEVCCGLDNPPRYSPVVANRYLQTKINPTSMQR